MRRLILAAVLLFSSAAHAAAPGVPVFSEWLKRTVLPPASGTHPGTKPVTTEMDPLVAYCFDADGEHFHYIVHTPADWDGVSDLTILFVWTNEAANAIAQDETVIWKIVWYWINPAIVQTYDAGTPVTATGLYTQTGVAGTDKDLHATAVVIDHDHADQQIGTHGLFHFTLQRDMTNDTYAKDACLIGLQWQYYSNGLPGR